MTFGVTNLFLLKAGEVFVFSSSKDIKTISAPKVLISQKHG